MNGLRHFLLAVQFFTRIPITGRLAAFAGFSPEALRRSAAHFPGVGVLVGLVCGGSFWLLLGVFPETPATPWVCGVISTTVGVLFTGGFHEDGLADLADGLGGVVSRERALEIMKDSRIGTFGALSLILSLVGKLAMLCMLAHVDWRLASLVVFAAHVVSRTTPLYVIASLKHVGDVGGSKSKPLADRITKEALLVGMIWCVGALTLVWWAAPSAGWGRGLAGAALATWWVRRFLQRRLGGFTGDGLGTVQQLSELAFYIGVAVA